MMLISFSFTIQKKSSEGSNAKGGLEWSEIDLIYPFYAMIWMLSLYLQYFEYKRGLSHAWQCHLLFWGLSTISHFVILIMALIDHPGLLDKSVNKT